MFWWWHGSIRYNFSSPQPLGSWLVLVPLQRQLCIKQVLSKQFIYVKSQMLLFLITHNHAININLETMVQTFIYTLITAFMVTFQDWTGIQTMERKISIKQIKFQQIRYLQNWNNYNTLTTKQTKKERKGSITSFKVA